MRPARVDDDPRRTPGDAVHAPTERALTSRRLPREATTGVNARDERQCGLYGQEVPIREATYPIAVVCRLRDFNSATPLPTEMTADLDRGTGCEVGPGVWSVKRSMFARLWREGCVPSPRSVDGRLGGARLLSMAPSFPIFPNEPGLDGKTYWVGNGEALHVGEIPRHLSPCATVSSRGERPLDSGVGAPQVSREVVLTKAEWSSAGNLSRGARHEN